jgi:hypothetical protein
MSANTGNVGVGTSSTKLSFVPSTGALTATKFIGDGSSLTNLAAAAKTQTMSFTFYVPSVADGELLRMPAVFGFTVTAVTAVCATGSTTITPKLNSVAMTGTAVSATTTKSSQSYTGGNVVSAGDDVIFTASSSSSCTNLAVTVTTTRVFS